jgi:hypothetical protein
MPERKVGHVTYARPLTRLERAEGQRVEAPTVERPRTRGDCVDAPRPCPWVSCRHHLSIEVFDSGSFREVFPGLALAKMVDTCSLDVADRGSQTLETVASHMHVTRERVRQIETSTLSMLTRRRIESERRTDRGQGLHDSQETK